MSKPIVPYHSNLTPGGHIGPALRSRRKSIRLKHYDYASGGYYFITLCIQQQLPLLGHIHDDAMILNDAGQMVEKWYYALASKFPSIRCDEWISMPNHVHFILENTGDATEKPSGYPASEPINPPLPSPVVGADRCVRPDLGSGYAGGHAGPPLRTVIQWFKTMTTNDYIQGVKTAQWPAFSGQLWQRNYYEHVIRSESSYWAIKDYIINNPRNWRHDDYHPLP